MAVTVDHHSEEPRNREREARLATGIQNLLLGETPTLTRLDLVEQSGVDLATAVTLWRLLGFPQVADDVVAFTSADADALRQSAALMHLGVVSVDSQAALVRTLARSFARLAEWQVRLLAELRRENDATDEQHLALIDEVLPQIEAFQDYVWRRHLSSATASLMSGDPASDAAGPESGEQLAIGFVDIVGYTSQSRKLDEHELVTWIEGFESAVTEAVLDRGGQVIKTIGDEVLFVADSPRDAAEIALVLAERGQDEDDAFPSVRAGIAFGDVVRRLGDVLGPTVNVASRLTSVARPGTVVADHGVHDALCTDHGPDETRADDLKLRRIPNVSVKGYGRIDCWVVRRRKS